VFTDAAESADDEEESDGGWSSIGSSGRDIGFGRGFDGAPFRLCRNRSDILGSTIQVQDILLLCGI
jgi:hypothetical protein